MFLFLVRLVVPKIIGQVDVLHVHRLTEQGGYLPGREARDAAAYRGDQEGLLGMSPGVAYESLHVGGYGLHAALHGGDGVAPSLRTLPLSPFRAEVEPGGAGSSSPVPAIQVAAKHEHLTVLQGGDSLRRDAMVVICLHGQCLYGKSSFSSRRYDFFLIIPDFQCVMCLHALLRE